MIKRYIPKQIFKGFEICQTNGKNIVPTNEIRPGTLVLLTCISARRTYNNPNINLRENTNHRGTAN